MANASMMMHGIISIKARPVKKIEGIFTPAYCRTLIVQNADGTKLELSLFSDTPEAVEITEVA